MRTGKPEGIKPEIAAKDGRYKCIVCSARFRMLTLDGKRFARPLGVSKHDKKGHFCCNDCAIVYAVYCVEKLT